MADLSFDTGKTCQDCKTSEHLRLDHSSGDLVCTNCGLVADEKAFDEGQDWRSFADGSVSSGQDGNSKQRADASGAFDAMLDEQARGTGMSGGSGAWATGLQRAQEMVQREARSAKSHHPHDASGAGGSAFDAQAAADPAMEAQVEQERRIIVMTDTLRKTANRLTLGESVVQRCVAFLQELTAKGQLSKQKKRPWFCALIYLASREEGATQTIREIAQANADYRRSAPAVRSTTVKGVRKDLPTAEKIVNSSALENSITEQVKELTKQLGLAKSSMTYAEDPELMARLVGRLQLAPMCAKPASQIVLEAFRQGKLLGAKINRLSQATMMAAAIFIVAWLLDVEQKPEIRHVASIARVSPSQVIDAYTLLRPKLRYLMPKDFVCRLKDGVNGLPAKPQAS